MEVNEISDMFLLYQYSLVQKQIAELYTEKKKLETEIGARVDRLQQLYKRGEFKMEMEAKE